MGQVSYSSPKSFEDMAENDVVVAAPVAEVVNVAAEAVAEVNNIEVAEEVTEVVTAETDRNDEATA